MAWNPLPEAVHVEAIVDPGDATAGSVLVEHFDDPYVADLPDGKFATLLAKAREYVLAVTALPQAATEFTLPEHWFDAIDPAKAGVELFFGWLDEESQDVGATHTTAPYGSFRVRGDAGAMLFASDRLAEDAYMGSGFGFAVPVHLRAIGGGGVRATFSSFAATLPRGLFLTAPLTPARLGILSLTLASLLQSDEASAAVQAASGLANVAFRGVRIALPDSGPPRVELHGVGSRNHAGVPIPYAVTVQGTWTPGHDDFSVTHTSPLVADADGTGSVFVDDPSSQAGVLVPPSRDALDSFRSQQPIGNGKRVELAYPSGAPIVKVMPCPRFVPADRSLDPKKPRPVSLPGKQEDPPVRSDDASAVQAFFHARDLVDRLKAYGWSDPASYFHVMRPEVRIQYHSGVVPGPGKDGRTVNARVIPEGWRRDQMGKNPTDPRPAVHVHVAAANLRRRARGRWQPGGEAAAATALGLAADRRWLWHEFGHVLLVASTGELEFRFAHSAGDALAAIVADPESRLDGPLRALTFPFVFLPRHHNRCAHAGWSWTGSLHAALAAVPGAQQPRRKGYASEQILSSSLFRLYRCLGGDTCVDGDAQQPARAERLRASDYAAFLIIQAMSLMGDARVHVIATPAQFVNLLVHADGFAGAWAAAPAQRVGGTARKVIRWAFEAQGLHGNGDDVGSPPKVDVYIRDRRPESDAPPWDTTSAGSGSYVPVSMHWQSAGGQAALWQADPQAGVVVTGNGHVDVLVGNRGTHTAIAVEVQVWWAAWNADAPVPQWNDTAAGWTQCTATSDPQDIASRDDPARFQFTYAAPATRHLLLAIAGCAADRPNTDASLGLPCGTLPTPLVDLVGNDNNLALLVIA